MEIRSQRDTLKITPWENSEKDVTCLLDCKIDQGWHVAVWSQLPHSSSLIDNAIILGRCPSQMHTILTILEMGSSIEEGNVFWDHMAAYLYISIIQRVFVCFWVCVSLYVLKVKEVTFLVNSFLISYLMWLLLSFSSVYE